MKDLLSSDASTQVSDGVLSVIVANWDRIVDNLREVIQRLLDNPEFVGHMKELFQNIL